MVAGRFARWMYRGRATRSTGANHEPHFGVGLCARVARDYLVTLEVTGRLSGRRISLPLVMVFVDGRRYLVSMLGEKAAWARNIRAGDGKAVLKHGQRERVRLEEIPIDQRAPVLKAYLQRAPGARPHVLVDKDAALSEFGRIADKIPVFRVLAVP
jgi:F420H(2)-dependent quinone reductase